MKTRLKQQINLVDNIRAEPSRVIAVKMLRNFLEDNGYEEPYKCSHYTVVRETGRCYSCGKRV